MKFFYCIGVYSFCVGIHKTIQSLPFALKEAARAVKQLCDVIDDEENKTNEKEKHREYVEIKHKEQKRTMNRIGF